MKKSTIHVICCLAAALILAAVVLVLAYFEMLPGVYDGVRYALHITIGALALVFVLSAFSTCKCTRRLYVALCRYGAALVIGLVIALLLLIAMFCIPVIMVNSILFLVVLFFSAAAFLFSLFVGTAMLHTLVSLGCPQCRPTPTPCGKDAELEDFTL